MPPARSRPLTVGSAEEARRAVDAGVDVIVAQGWEAGGHVWGEVSTLALVPAVVDAVAEHAGDRRRRDHRWPRPRRRARARGRRRLDGHALRRQRGGAGPPRLEGAAASAPRRRTRSTRALRRRLAGRGAPRRCATQTIDAWLAAGSPPSGERPGEGEVLATAPDGSEVVRYSSVSARASLVGRIDDLSLWCGPERRRWSTRSCRPREIVRARRSAEAERRLLGASSATGLSRPGRRPRRGRRGRARPPPRARARAGRGRSRRP